MTEVIKIFSYKNKNGYLAILTLYNNDIYDKLEKQKEKIKEELEKKLNNTVNFEIVFVRLDNINNDNENNEDDISIILNSNVFLYPYKLAYLNIDKLKITKIKEIT